MKSGHQQKPEFEQDVGRDDERKTRKCLVCKVEFLSEWAGVGYLIVFCLFTGLVEWIHLAY